jgi:hypothetical protein
MLLSKTGKLKLDNKQTSKNIKPQRIMVFGDSNSLRSEVKRAAWTKFLEKSSDIEHRETEL